MRCKKCGCEIKESWKYCPNCSKRIYKKQNIIIVCLVLLVLALIIIIPIIKYNILVNERYIEKQLEEKYNEKFSDVSFIKSEDNKDTDISCDGSHFGTIKGEGEVKYYKVYSEKNKLEFMATYDTSDKEKTINDNYLNSLRRRSTIIEAYNIIYDYLYNINYKIILVEKDNKVSINSRNELEDILSKYAETDINYDGTAISIEIDEDLYDFCVANYEAITKLNNKLVELSKNNDYYFSTDINLNLDATIELYRLDDKPYIYNKYGSHAAWGETLDEFIARES